MSSIRLQYLNKSWTKDEYLISTDPSLIPIAELSDFFASDDMYWAKTIPHDALEETVRNSLCFGLYEQTSAGVTHESNFVGFARCITDFTTFLYLTDVYTKPAHRRKSLGKWLISCVQETIDTMPYLRRTMFITSDWERSVPFYEKLMGVSVMESQRPRKGENGGGIAVLTKTGPGWPQ